MSVTQGQPLSREGDSDSDASSSASSISAIPSTFKTLSPAVSDNVFAELETTRGTSWQFELHQREFSFSPFFRLPRV